ncbi:hypothetical protein OA518_01750, partial [Prochlorococcus sp. AH-716-F10]|nr:hypothetical protein [Prochlorococcus sp. AH-716-F10]
MINNNKESFIQFFQKIKNIDFVELIESIRNTKFEDFKNLDYKRLFADIKRSKYAKPSAGILSATFLSIFVFYPTIETINSSFRKVKQYRGEANTLDNKKIELVIESKKFNKIKELFSEVNDSFLKQDEIIFLTEMLNEVSKKSNVVINSFSPIFQEDTSKFCKKSLASKNNNQFKTTKKNNIKKKGPIQDRYFDVQFTSEYLDIVKFLKEIQLYDVNLITFCLEVSSENIKKSTSSDNKEEKNSIIIPLTKDGLPTEIPGSI